MSITVRPCLPSEADGLLAFWAASGAEPTSTDDVDSVARLLGHDSQALMVADDDGQLVGSVIAAWDGWRGSVYRLVIAPSHRRQGLARCLLKEAMPERAGRLAPRRLTWTSLYVLTFTVLMICGFIRGVAAYIVIWIAFKILGQPTDLVNTLALIVAYGPMLYSLAILFWPKLYGAYWQRAVGGRRASDREQQLIDQALELLLTHQPGLRPPAHIFIRDDPTINAAVCADRIELNTGALFDEGLPATLAHELGHLNSEDGRLTAATYALALFPHLARDSRITAKGLFVSIVTGEAGLWLFQRPWAAYYRQREYHADEYAARLGQGPQLAWSLQNSALLHDRPVPFSWMSQNSHPPTELRIERLQRFADQHH